jgi:hypothetical protein
VNTVTPLHHTPALPASSSTSDRAHAVIDLLPVYLELAGRIANTEFVPSALRRRPEAVLAALMSGAERGLGPMESLRSVHVIEGRPTLSAEAMRALVLAAGHDIEIVESNAQKATVVGRRAGSDSTSPPFTWTLDRARRARLVSKDNWTKYPEAMLLARASTDLCRAVFPDVIAGLASTEEITDELAPEPATTTRRTPARRPSVPVAPAPAPEIAPAVETPKEERAMAPTAGASPVAPAPVSRTGSPVAAGATDDELDEIPGSDQPTWGTAPTSSKPAPSPAAHDKKLAKRIHAEIAKAFPDADDNTRDRYRHALVVAATRKRPDGPVTSSSDLDLEEQLRLSEALTRVIAGEATVADGADDTIEIRAGGGWRYTITLDPPAVVDHRHEPEESPDDGQ